jgi:hypothetical protein
VATGNDVLVLGGAGVDTVVYVPLPLPFADSYMVPAIETRSLSTNAHTVIVSGPYGIASATATRLCFISG